LISEKELELKKASSKLRSKKFVENQPVNSIKKRNRVPYSFESFEKIKRVKKSINPLRKNEGKNTRQNLQRKKLKMIVKKVKRRS